MVGIPEKGDWMYRRRYCEEEGSCSLVSTESHVTVSILMLKVWFTPHLVCSYWKDHSADASRLSGHSPGAQKLPNSCNHWSSNLCSLVTSTFIHHCYTFITLFQVRCHHIMGNIMRPPMVYKPVLTYWHLNYFHPSWTEAATELSYYCALFYLYIASVL